MSEWKSLLTTLWRKTREPFANPAFIFYFLVVVLGLGGFGIWYPLITNTYKPDDKVAEALLWRSVITGVYTFYVALVATSIVDSILTREKRYSYQMFVIFCGFLSFAVALVVATKVSAPEFKPGLFELPTLLVIFGFMLSLYLWWIVNADNNNLRDVPLPNAATGGNTSNDLPGTTEGYAT